MSKKKKNKSLSFPDRSVFISIIAAVVFAVLVIGLLKYFQSCDYFKVKVIMIDPSLQYINKEDLSRYKGANIFSIDLSAVQKRLSQKYPQISELKAVRRYPDQLLLLAKKRIPFVQARIKGQTVTFDDDGVILSKASRENKELSFVKGIPDDINMNLGEVCRDEGLASALAVVKMFKGIAALSAYDILNIDVKNLSKIELTLNNNLTVYMDRLDIGPKLKVLSVVLSQGKLDLKTTKYVDLRFKEPILGTK